MNATYVRKHSQIKVHTEGIQKLIHKKDSSLVTFAHSEFNEAHSELIKLKKDNRKLIKVHNMLNCSLTLIANSLMIKLKTLNLKASSVIAHERS